MITNKRILILCAFLTLHSVFSFSWFGKKVEPHCLAVHKGEYNPKNTVFLVDFHNVLAYTDWRKGSSILMNNPDKIMRVRRLISYYWHKLLKSDTIHDFSLHEYLNAGDTSNEYKATNIAWVSSFWVDPKATALMKKIHDAGYKLVLFSNTPKETILYMQREHPELFDLFSELWYRSREHNITKRMPQAFDEIKELSRKALGHEPQHYIFLDDTKGNIRRGNEQGICGILFKNPEQTERMLKLADVLK